MTEAYRSSQTEETTRGILRDKNNSDVYTLLPSPNTNSASMGSALAVHHLGTESSDIEMSTWRRKFIAVQFSGRLALSWDRMQELPLC